MTIKYIGIGAGTILMHAELTLANAEQLVGRRVMLLTLSANEQAPYEIEKVWVSRDSGDLMAWVNRGGFGGGKHANIVAKSK